MILEDRKGHNTRIALVNKELTFTQDYHGKEINVGSQKIRLRNPQIHRSLLRNFHKNLPRKNFSDLEILEKLTDSE